MRFERLLLVVLVAIVSVVAWAFSRRAPETPPAPAPSMHSTPVRMVPAFTLETMVHYGVRDGVNIMSDGDSDGPVTFQPGGRPAFIAVSDVTSAASRGRVHLDRQAYELADSYQVPCYDILVHADKKSGMRFLQDTGAWGEHYDDREAADAATAMYGIDDGRLANGLQASEADCWIVVDPAGRITWQGGPDLKALRAALEPLARHPTRGTP